MKKNIKVAVYGSLRKGLGNHVVLSGADYLGESTVTFPANMRSYGAFPYVHTKNNIEKVVKPIKVELYAVDEEGLQRLDCLEGYPHFYNRSEFVFKDGTMAWMYHIEEEQHQDHTLVIEGDWKEFLERGRT